MCFCLYFHVLLFLFLYCRHPVLSLVCCPIVCTCSVFSPWLVCISIPCSFFINKCVICFDVLLSLSSAYLCPLTCLPHFMMNDYPICCCLPMIRIFRFALIKHMWVFCLISLHITSSVFFFFFKQAHSNIHILQLEVYLTSTERYLW